MITHEDDVKFLHEAVKRQKILMEDGVEEVAAMHIAMMHFQLVGLTEKLESLSSDIYHLSTEFSLSQGEEFEGEEI